MMIDAGQYSDTLRALGSFIERTGASSVEIVDRGDHWLVAATLGSETLFSTFMLRDLREESRRRRGDERPDGTLSKALRAIGFELDAAEARSFSLRQVGEGFLVTATCPSGETANTYSLEQIEAIAVEMQELRQADPAGR